VTQQATNILTIQEQVLMSTIQMPCKLIKNCATPLPIKFGNFASPMTHSVTGKMISSYKKLMHDQAMAEVWQTAFGKDFDRMAQGSNKMGQKGTNAMFVMIHDKICHALLAKKFFTYTNPVIDYRSQKDNPYPICITAGGNLIIHNGDVSIHTADIDTAN
jgi:hypothetical protein